MKRALLFLAAALALVVPAQPASAIQSNTSGTAQARARTAKRSSSHDRHHHRQGPSSRHHRRHKASAKHS